MKRILLIGMIIALLSLTGCVEQDAKYETLEASTNLYECEERGITMPCESLSKYVSPEGKCWNSELGNKICKPGWKEISYTEDLPECIFFGPSNTIYVCNENECVLRQ